jgi:hypothetical protein
MSNQTHPMFYRFTFKFAYGTETKNYIVNSNWSMSDFLFQIKSDIYYDYDIIQNEYNIEIIEAGQYDNINGRDAELAPKIEPSNQTVFDLYGFRYKYVSFYIKIVPKNV